MTAIPAPVVMVTVRRTRVAMGRGMVVPVVTVIRVPVVTVIRAPVVMVTRVRVVMVTRVRVVTVIRVRVAMVTPARAATATVRRTRAVMVTRARGATTATGHVHRVRRRGPSVATSRAAPRSPRPSRLAICRALRATN
ncbi:hypothetical protein O1W71_11790 [Microbacterium sp. H37-C3]|uniref:hypothetical protein n=1 Tax=Microbacterium sp. H37-C3 TaxID=3004354 RepID=UPI0022AE7939|nr:hypothetical protein [Microbacterium sp. H37-C3]MCZ4068352.1 hypothetical protein [Microbacterium sp. H37-C3]